MGCHYSLGYQIATSDGLADVSNKDSRKQYTSSAKDFGRWCKQEHDCRDFEDCRPYIQPYVDMLADKGLSASTIHTYLAGICRAWQVDMKDIEKPKRVSAKNTRSRGEKAVDKRNDAKAGVSPRLEALAKAVGIRRREYAALKGNNFVQDESGYWCVEVRKGKGGKYQLQRVPEDKIEFVRTYFDGTQNYVFSKDELKNKIDLHAARAKVAQRMYFEYEQRLRLNPDYRSQLIAEVKSRWKKYNRRKFNHKDITGGYMLRGKNRELAIKSGAPVVYDRLALMAVSIFHLSHWRLDVAVSNYLLAK